MKINEIVSSKKEKNIDNSENFRKEFENFLREMAKNTNPKITMFLLEHPLYRADSYSEGKFGNFFGIKPIRKNRTPVDTPLYYSKILDEFLSSKGIRAGRLNSIFATGDEKFITIFFSKTSGKERKSLVIFPSRKFYFSWNPYIKDFYFPKLVMSDLIEKVLSISYEEMTKYPKETYKVVEDFIEKYNMKNLTGDEYDEYDEHNNEEDQQEKIYNLLSKFLLEKNSKKRTRILEKIMKELHDTIFSTSSLVSDEIYGDFLKIMEEHFTESSLEKILKIPNNEVTNAFTDRNFEEAVKSGNEIMITNDIFYYFDKQFFFSKRKFIIEKLKEFYNIS
jgi:hypothetical protein